MCLHGSTFVTIHTHSIHAEFRYRMYRFFFPSYLFFQDEKEKRLCNTTWFTHICRLLERDLWSTSFYSYKICEIFTSACLVVIASSWFTSSFAKKARLIVVSCAQVIPHIIPSKHRSIMARSQNIDPSIKRYTILLLYYSSKRDRFFFHKRGIFISRRDYVCYEFEIWKKW